MGTFDWLRCEYPLPDAAAQDLDFQSKDTPAQDYANYIITADGRLIEKDSLVDLPPLPLGSPAWGVMRRQATVDVDANFNGDLSFYAEGDSDEWFEFCAVFRDGSVVEVRRAKNDTSEVMEGE